MKNKSLTFRFDKSVCISFSLVDYIYFVILCISEYEEIVAWELHLDACILSLCLTSFGLGYAIGSNGSKTTKK